MNLTVGWTEDDVDCASKFCVRTILFVDVRWL